MSAARVDVGDHLSRMRAALDRHNEAYREFVALTQNGEWVPADAQRLAASAFLEIAMDEFTSACRLNRENA